MSNPYHLPPYRYAQHDTAWARMLAIPHAPLVLATLAALVIERRRHPDAKRQRSRKLRDLTFDRCRALKEVHS